MTKLKNKKLHIKTFFYILFGITLITSCSTVKHASKYPTLQPINNTNFYLLKGNYYNQPINDQRNKSYTSTYDATALNDVQLLKQFFLLDDDWQTVAERVQLLLVKNTLQVTAVRQDKIITQFNINGKFSKGYFKTKKEHRTSFPPIPPFYYFNKKVRLYITLDSTNNLVIQRKGKNTGMILFFGTSFKMDNTYSYAPYNTSVFTDSLIKKQ